jgi:cytoskeletal protein RodZ
MNGEIIGRRLRAAREAQNLSLEQVSRATYIRVHYLQSMEAGEFDNLPSQAQARGFLRSVASYLKMDPEPLLIELDQPVGSSLPRSLVASSTVVGAEDTETLPTEAPFRETGDLPAGTPLVEAGKDKKPPPSAQPAEVQSIFKGIGGQLQTRRELLGLSIEDVVRHTRLRGHYIRALESGEFDRLPSSVQGRGMLNNYASFLGIDPEPLLLRFAEGLQTGLALRQGRSLPGQAGGGADASSSSTPQSTPPNGSTLPPRRTAHRFGNTLQFRRFFSLELIFVGLTALALIAFAIWGGLRITELLNPDQTVPTAPSIVEVLLATETPQPTQTLTPTPGNFPGPTSQPGTDSTEAVSADSQSIASGSNVQLYLTIYQRALLNIIVDGEPQFAGRVLPGTAYTFSGKDQIELTTSNGAAIQVFYNGEDQGLLGLFGQVVYRIYTTQGIITPTPTLTLTPTPTQVPTATPEPTRTISPNLPEAPTVPALP